MGVGERGELGEAGAGDGRGGEGGGVAGLGGDLGDGGGGGGRGGIPWRLGRRWFSSWRDWGRATGRTRGGPPGAQVDGHIDPGVAILTV